MIQVPMTFFCSNSSFDQLYVKSPFNGVDYLYSINRIYGLNRIVSTIAGNSFQPMNLESAATLLSQNGLVCIRDSLLFLHEGYEDALFKIAYAVSAVLNTDKGERQALKIINLSAEQCEGVTELDLSNCGIHVLPPQIFELFKNLKKLNLRGNDLKSLPHELKYLSLSEINVEGNTWLQPNLPNWIKKIALVTLPNGSRLETEVTNDLQLFQANPQFSFFF